MKSEPVICLAFPSCPIATSKSRCLIVNWNNVSLKASYSKLQEIIQKRLSFLDNLQYSGCLQYQKLQFIVNNPSSLTYSSEIPLYTGALGCEG